MEELHGKSLYRPEAAGGVAGEMTGIRESILELKNLEGKGLRNAQRMAESIQHAAPR